MNTVTRLTCYKPPYQSLHVYILRRANRHCTENEAYILYRLLCHHFITQTCQLFNENSETNLSILLKEEDKRIKGQASNDI